MCFLNGNSNESNHLNISVWYRYSSVVQIIIYFRCSILYFNWNNWKIFPYPISPKQQESNTKRLLFKWVDISSTFYFSKEPLWHLNADTLSSVHKEKRKRKKKTQFRSNRITRRKPNRKFTFSDPVVNLLFFSLFIPFHFLYVLWQLKLFLSTSRNKMIDRRWLPVLGTTRIVRIKNIEMYRRVWRVVFPNI